MTNRRTFIQIATAGAALAAASPALAELSPTALLDRYITLKNARDATHCGDIYSENYAEHSGRNPSGLAALIANWQGQFDLVPDMQLTLDDRIISGDKVVARITYSGTHTKPFLGIPPTGRRFSFGTIDIWRVEGGRFAEHWDQVDFAGLSRQLRAA